MAELGAELVEEPVDELGAVLTDEEALEVLVGSLQGMKGPPGPTGPTGAVGPTGIGLTVVSIDGADVPLPVLPALAIAPDAVAPNLGPLHALAWSTLADAPVVWTGRAWREVYASGSRPGPDQLENEQGELLINAQGEEVTLG